jgi:hypothetical protein
MDMKSEADDGRGGLMIMMKMMMAPHGYYV